MELKQKYTIDNTTFQDWDLILELFDKAIKNKRKDRYKVWNQIDESGIKNDIAKKLQYKVKIKEQVSGIFSIQFNDPFIWRERDCDKAI